MLISARARRRGVVSPDAAALLGCVALVAAAVLVGRALLARGVEILLGFPPLNAEWLPHVGPGTPAALLVAGLVATRGPALAERLAWRPLLAGGYAVSVAWTSSLALVDGWQRGVAGRLATGDEYLHDVPRAGEPGTLLRTFADHILTSQVDPGQTEFWTTHVGAHPPGAFLVFVLLDRAGLGGGAWAGVFVLLTGASSAVAVAVAVRALGGQALARRVLPFAVLAPAAVWVGVSADGLFAAALAWAVALAALGATGTGWRADCAALAGGVCCGGCLYLSYGLVLGMALPGAVLLVARRVRAAVLVGAGSLLVVAGFTASGFWWFTGFERVRVIYAASAAASRPYAYFVWANLAAFLFAMGPAAVVGLRRALAAPRALPVASAALVGAALVAVLFADLSGLSKAEVERIWLPFAVWLAVPCALLDRPARWLLAQAGLALVVNHLLLTVW
ncbi:hypothetical protein [Pseudonocardia acaciae]|uniref:hypothetical protein n=1 Tax=Pseudonocardia acaciae TaxID=551276 RepID=UPI001FE11A44|nr:hypothetical protein [Pseudonocardia acaciae]